MIFQVQGRGINVNEAPWNEAIRSAFQPVIDHYAEAVQSISILLDCESKVKNKPGCRCYAKLALKYWPEFEITELGDDQHQVIDRSAAAVMRTLAVIVRTT